eukprot:637835-Pleurochrysis_carterae.AAC.2
MGRLAPADKSRKQCASPLFTWLMRRVQKLRRFANSSRVANATRTKANDIRELQHRTKVNASILSAL